MSPSTLTPTVPSGPTGPAWEIALLFPEQGDWGAEEYLAVSERSNYFVELSAGRVEVLELPGKIHQRIVAIFHALLEAFVQAKRLGETVIAPYPVKVAEGVFREPDIVFMLAANVARMGDQFSDGADLVVEVLSKDRNRDLVTKRAEYAEANIAEYWIIDPRDSRVTVLTLRGGEYVEHGSFGLADRATSRLLEGFEVEVATVLKPAQR
jgi:Uma2 family endonuclease